MKTAEVAIESCAAGRGHGVAHAERMTLFVPGALPKDVVEIRWEPPSGKRGWAVARAVRLVEASPLRAVPPCPHACTQPENVGESCGGCPWMALLREEQVRQKIAIARHAFRGFSLPDPIVPRIPGQNERLRCRSRMNAAGGKLGFFAALSSHVVDIRACPMMQHPEAHDFLRTFLPGKVPVEIRQLQGRDGAIHLTLDAPIRTGFETLSAAFPKLAGVRIAGEDFGAQGIWVDTPGFGPLRVSSAGFFQAGPEINALILEALRECLDRIDSPGPILEGYAGAGNCTRVIRQYGDAISVESDPESCRFFNENMELYKTAGGSVRLVPVPMEQFAAGPIPVKPRTLVLDPPRTGVGLQLSTALTALAPDNVILISCDPASGARDARVWIDAGYHLAHWILIDSMPHTAHMEVVQLLMR